MRDELFRDFAWLRHGLERAAEPPGFSTILRARMRRTFRWAAASVAMVVLLSAGAVLGLTAARGGGPDVVGPGPTTTPAPAPTTGPAPTSAAATTTPSTVDTTHLPVLVAMATTPSGTLFGVAQTCVSGCAGGAEEQVLEFTLVRSTDLAGHWTRVGAVPGVVQTAMRLFAADDQRLWLVQYGYVWGSSNGGRNWQRWTQLPDPFGGHWDAGESGGTMWVVHSGQTMFATGGGRPVASNGIPFAPLIVRVMPVSADGAYIVDSNGLWLVTSDRGGHFTSMTDPCVGTPGEASTFDTLVAGGGARWLVCAGEPVGGQQPKRLKVSTDGGTVWSDRGALESSGYGTQVHPFSSTVAWRTGGRSPIRRTTNGTSWTVVANLPDGPNTFAAVDATTALYTETGESGGRTVFVTRDGGRTWTPRPFSF